MTNAKNNAEPTAAETYAKNGGDIARLLDVLQMELDRHHEKAKADPRNWGLVGNLDHVRGDLINLVAFVSNRDRREIEAFLDEAE